MGIQEAQRNLQDWKMQRRLKNFKSERWKFLVAGVVLHLKKECENFVLYFILIKHDYIALIITKHFSNVFYILTKKIW